MDYRFESYCGLYCGACEILRANRENRVEEVAKAWGMKPEDLICEGCKSEVNCSDCRACEIKECAREKGVEFCFECSDYPCNFLTDLQKDDHPHHAVILENLNKIKSNGLDNWLAEQKQRWSCANCGTEASWYASKCKKCGAELVSCEE